MLKIATHHSSDRQNFKVWIDLDNTPHVPFFMPILSELRSRGYKVVLTARDAYQVRELVNSYNLPARIIGHHYGKNKAWKVWGFLYRTMQLAPLIIRERPDLAFSLGSRSQLLLGKLIRIPVVITFDYEYSQHIPFLLPDRVIVPEILAVKINERIRDRAITYPGIKEDIYVPEFHPTPNLRDTLGLREQDLLVTLRPPATEAHYHNHKSDTLFDAVVTYLASIENLYIVLLPRSERQAAQIRQEWSYLFGIRKLIIPDGVLNGLDLLWHSDFVISGGGTMNREAAALGVPVYSIFGGKIGAIDQYLADIGRLVLLESSDDIRSKISITHWDRSHQSVHSTRPLSKTIVDDLEMLLS